MKRGILGCLFLMLMWGCQHQPKSAGSFEVCDGYGRRVSVPEEAKRVVSLSPAVTEIVFALGAGERLVGRTDFCSYPPEAEGIPSVGGISNLNIEAVAALKPDLVISGSMVPKKQVEQLGKLGIPVVCFPEGQRFDDLYKNIEGIASALGVDSDSLVASCRPVAAPSTANPPTLYYVVGYGKGGNFTAGGNTFINDIIQLAGCRNIAEDLEGWSFSQEALLEADPDYILIREEDAASFAQMPPYNRLKAVRTGHVIPIESGLIDQQCPRNVEAIRVIAEAL